MHAAGMEPSELTVCSVKNTAISHSLDGTEDDALWADNDQEAANDVSQEESSDGK